MTRLRAVMWGIILLVTCFCADLWYLTQSEKLAQAARLAVRFALASDVRWESIEIEGFSEIIVRELQLMRPDEPDRIYGTIDEVRVTIRPWRLPFADASVIKGIDLKNARGMIRWNPKTGLLDMPSPLRPEYGNAQGGSLADIPVVRLDGLYVTLEHAPYVLKPRQDLAFPGLRVDVMPDGSDRWLYRFGVRLENNPLFGTFDVSGKFNAQGIQLSIDRPGDLVGAQLREILREPEDRRTAELLAGLSVKGDIGFGIAIFGQQSAGPVSLGASLRLDGASVSHATIPVRLDNIRGQIALLDGVISTKSLTATYEGAELNISSQVDMRPTAPVLVDGRIDLVGLDLGGGFSRRLASLGGAMLKVDEQVDAWEPKGFGNFMARVVIPGPTAPTKSPTDPERPWLMIDLDLRKGVSLKYRGAVKEDGKRHGFPYLLEDAAGTVHFTDLAMSFDRITATHGSAFIEARGRIGYERANDETYDVDIVAQGITIDSTLVDALEPEGQELLASLDAEGMVDLLIGVKRTVQDPPGAPVIADVDLRGVRLRPREFPIVADDARGRVHIEGPIIRIDGVRARHRGGDLYVTGRLGTSEQAGLVSIKADFKRLPIEAPLFDALSVPSPEAVDELRSLGVFGHIGGSINLEAAVGKPLDVRGSLELDRVGLTLPSPKLRIENLEGILGLENGNITIREGTRATFSGERFAVKGQISPKTGIDLLVEADRFHLTEQFLSALAPAIPSFMLLENRPKLDGVMSAIVHARGMRDNVVLDTELIGQGVNAIFPNGLRLNDIEGRVKVAPDGSIAARDVLVVVPVARAGIDSRPADLMAPPRRTELAAATVTWTPAQEKTARSPARESKLSAGAITVRDAPLGASLFRSLALPEDLEASLVDLVLSGRLDATCRAIAWSPSTGWALGATEGSVADFAIGEDRRIEARLLRVNKGSFVDGEGGRAFRARLEGASVRAFDILMPKFASDMVCSGSSLELSRVGAVLFDEGLRDGSEGATGRLPGGRIEDESTRIFVKFAESAFEMHLAATDVSIPDLVRVFGAEPGEVWGRMRCDVSLAGPMSDRNAWVGKAQTSANVHNVVELPFFAKLFGIFDITKLFQGRNPGSLIETIADIHDSGFHMSLTRVASPDVSLKGRGWLGFDGRIRATFKAKYRAGFDPLSLLGFMVKGLAASTVSVSGTLGSPDVTLSEIDVSPLPMPAPQSASRPDSAPSTRPDSRN